MTEERLREIEENLKWVEEMGMMRSDNKYASMTSELIQALRWLAENGPE
jgi:hypothetical protein